MLLVQGTEDLAFIAAVTAVFIHQCTMDTGTDCIVFVQGRGEMAVMSAVTAVLLYQCAMDTGTDCCVVCTGNRRNGGFVCSYFSTFNSVCYGYRV